jgi:hypothetical protein
MVDKDWVNRFNQENPDKVNPNGSHPLQSKWVLWTHKPHSENSDWTIRGYEQQATISTVEEFWYVMNGLPSMNNPDMWFLMKYGIPPIWEDPVNAQGGAFKFRISNACIDNAFLSLAVHVVTGHICRDPLQSRNISGISVSPKGGNLTLSIWNNDATSVDCAQFPTNIPGISFQVSLYQSHQDRAQQQKGGYRRTWNPHHRGSNNTWKKRVR